MFYIRFKREFCYIVFWYLGGNRRNLRFHLILTVNFYYIINKLIILIPDSY
jgi:hypothetical protein